MEAELANNEKIVGCSEDITEPYGMLTTAGGGHSMFERNITDLGWYRERSKAKC